MHQTSTVRDSAMCGVAGRFKRMVATMNPSAKQLRQKSFVEGMCRFYNSCHMWGMEPEALSTEALWELKDVDQLTQR